jgi:hypothetical protein
MTFWQTVRHVVVAVAVTACSSLVFAAATNPSPDEPERKPPPTRSIDHPTGATESGSRGEVSGSMTTTPEPAKERQRGNTPPGKDREGHGPASGAIVDPAGVATDRKPF